MAMKAPKKTPTNTLALPITRAHITSQIPSNIKPNANNIMPMTNLGVLYTFFTSFPRPTSVVYLSNIPVE
jgi:hypothetical protein